MLTILAWLVVYVTGCLMALARHPIYGSMVYVLVLYVSPSDRWWGQGALAGIRWALIAATVTVIALVIHRPKRPPSPFLGQPLILGFLVLIAWVGMQSFWALDPVSHQSLLVYYVKFAMAMYLIYRSVDTVEHLRLFLWAHVLGCTYLGWIVFTTHVGGRFDDFGGAGIGDSNAGALAVVTGVLSAGSLFLSGGKLQRAALVLAAPFMVNAIVATMSRSAFLALLVGGAVFNFFAPPKFRAWVIGLSAVALLGFFLLTNPDYWGRIESLQYRGEQVEGVDTGHRRLLLAQAQLQMSRAHPLGCGSRCTDALSPLFLEESQLNEGTRSSHNTFLTMLVEQGIPGAILYVSLIGWVLALLRKLSRSRPAVDSGVALMFPAIAGSLVAMLIGDLFVQYPRFEIRFWFLTLGMLLLGMAAGREHAASQASPVGPQVPANDQVPRHARAG